MSHQTPGATLLGWTGPHYPSNIGELAALLSRRVYRALDLERVARTMPEAGPYLVQCCRPPAAGDGYVWDWVLHFKWFGLEVLLAIPGARGVSPSLQLDRSPAVYSRTGVPGDKAKSMLQAFLDALNVTSALR